MKIRSAREVAEEWGYTDYCGAVPPVNCGGTQPCAVCMVRKRDREIVEAAKVEWMSAWSNVPEDIKVWINNAIAQYHAALDAILAEEE